MEIIFGFIICFSILLVCIFNNIFVFYPLMGCLVVFGLIAIKRGFTLKEILIMSFKGGKKAVIVLQIFILIGAIISTWMSAGTVPAIVYYGMKIINPNIFILSAFLLCSFVSFLLGTSFGTVGTVGMAIIVMARGGGVSIPITAGAILSGAYFGDRCSPMSSSANLVASLTNTELYTNIKNMFKTSIVPLILSCILFGIFSIKYPLYSSKSNIILEITKNYNINIIVFIPAVLIFVLSTLKVNVKLSMFLSIVLALMISIWVQHYSISKVLYFITFGFTLDKNNPLVSIIRGGGILSMLKTALIVFVSSAITGIFEGTEMLESIKNLTMKTKNSYEVFLCTILISIVSAAFGCTQAIAIILTEHLMEKTYGNKNIDKHKLAVDIENSAVVLAPLIPWNIAVLIPLTSLNAGINSILFSFYLMLIPITNLVYYYFHKGDVSK